MATAIFRQVAFACSAHLIGAREIAGGKSEDTQLRRLERLPLQRPSSNSRVLRKYDELWSVSERLKPGLVVSTRRE